MRILFFVVVVLESLLAVSPASLAAGAGELDRTFSGDGIARHRFADTGSGQVMTDGSERVIVASGMTDRQVLSRFTADGRLDRAYGTRGSTVVLSGVLSSLNALHVEAGGGAVVAGRLGPDTVAFAKIAATGSLDPRFGVAGTAQVRMSAPGLVLPGLLRAPGGRLAVGVLGLGAEQQESRLALVGVTATGNADQRLGPTGIRPVTGPPASFGSVLVKGQTGFLAVHCGSTGLAEYTRLTDDGAVIESGQISFGFTPEICTVDRNEVVAAAISNGRLVVARVPADAPQQLHFARPQQAPYAYGQLVAARLDQEGRVVVLSAQSDGSTAVDRLRPDGRLDSAFGYRGRVFLRPSPDRSERLRPDDLTFDSLGRIVVLSSAGDGYGDYRQDHNHPDDLHLARLRSDPAPLLPSSAPVTVARSGRALLRVRCGLARRPCRGTAAMTGAGLSAKATMQTVRIPPAGRRTLTLELGSRGTSLAKQRRTVTLQLRVARADGRIDPLDQQLRLTP